ncbi:unnamed protein product [Heligmosomoides polygyrus]|uniref:C-type lectin domain-containing protein n=1 Tax=Heligmosomoides polygyrus TaxID=6339 RepID=A0A3P7ZRB0_HELPZ|nr:unnamed protein product [Heligmosomoides polygyrus]
MSELHFQRTDSNDAPLAIQTCPAGFTRSGDACYYVEIEKLDFPSAVIRCSQKGGTIFSPTSLEQWDVTSMTPAYFWTWTGIVQQTDVEEPHFKGPGAVDFFRNWLVKPFTVAANGWSIASKCAAFYNTGIGSSNYVFFYPCTSLYHSICQKNFDTDI